MGLDTSALNNEGLQLEKSAPEVREEGEAVRFVLKLNFWFARLRHPGQRMRMGGSVWNFRH